MVALVLAMIVCYIFLVGSLRSSGCCCYLRVGGCGLDFCGVILPFGGWVCVVVLGIGVVVLFGFSSGALAWFVWLTGSCLLSVWGCCRFTGGLVVWLKVGLCSCVGGVSNAWRCVLVWWVGVWVMRL